VTGRPRGEQGRPINSSDAEIAGLVPTRSSQTRAHRPTIHTTDGGPGTAVDVLALIPSWSEFLSRPSDRHPPANPSAYHSPPPYQKINGRGPPQPPASHPFFTWGQNFWVSCDFWCQRIRTSRLGHDVAMTDGPGVPELDRLTFEIRWPSSATRDPKVATKFAILSDDLGGAFLLIGHAPPPPWPTASDRQRGREEAAGLTLEIGRRTDARNRRPPD
jgi:hypothetical protein